MTQCGNAMQGKEIAEKQSAKRLKQIRFSYQFPRVSSHAICLNVNKYLPKKYIDNAHEHVYRERGETGKDSSKRLQ